MDDELKKILDALYSADQARKAAEKEQEKGNSPVAASFWNIAIGKSEFASAALHRLCGSTATRTPLPMEMIRKIERDYGLESDLLGTTPRNHFVLAELDFAGVEPGRQMSELIERLVRIGSAIVLGALAGDIAKPEDITFFEPGIPHTDDLLTNDLELCADDSPALPEPGLGS